MLLRASSLLALALLAPTVVVSAEEASEGGSANAFGEALGRQATLDFSFEPETDLDAGGAFSYADLRMSAPVYGKRLSPDWLFGARVRYRLSEFDWNQQSLFDNDLLQRVDINLSLIYKPEQSPWVGFLSAGPALATDGSNIDEEDLFFVAIAGLGYRVSDRFTLLGGAYFSQDFGESRLLPAPGFVWTPSETWTLSLVPPRLRVAYAPDDEWRIAAEAFPDGGRWSITTLDGEDAYLDRSGARVGLRVERRLFGNGWLHAGGGVMLGRDLVVETTGGEKRFDSEADAGAYFSTGFAWRF